MAAKYFIKPGFVGSDAGDGKLAKTGKFYLLKWLKTALTQLGISWQDPCCIGTSNPPDVTNIPVRLNKTANKLQYLDNITGVWTNVVAAQIS